MGLPQGWVDSEWMIVNRGRGALAGGAWGSPLGGENASAAAPTVRPMMPLDEEDKHLGKHVMRRRDAMTSAAGSSPVRTAWVGQEKHANARSQLAVALCIAAHSGGVISLRAGRLGAFRCPVRAKIEGRRGRAPEAPSEEIRYIKRLVGV
jgi:hypothetical protein